MIENILERIVTKEFPFELTGEQAEALHRICRFVMAGDSDRRAFILRGYAGTGKTTLIGALIRALHKAQRSPMLLAPTGRAAKVFSNLSHYAAFTIHKAIYRQKRVDDLSSSFSLNFNRLRNTLFIVDEASMIGALQSSQTLFGSGNLLYDLVEYVYSSPGCRLLLMGDTAQLPPVGEEESPALDVGELSSIGIEAESFELTQVMRQALESGILSSATRLRCQLAEDDVYSLPTIQFKPFRDIRRLPGSELIETLEECYQRDGLADTIVITRSNKHALQFNTGIRSQIFGREETLCRGDVLMVVKNNYYWTEQRASELTEEESLPMDFIANGDTAIVEYINHYVDLYGLHFADVTLSFPDYDDLELDVRIILDALSSDTPSLPSNLQQQLYEGVMEDYADYPTKRKRMEQMRRDPNYNALQVKYAYAVTCHKAQGGSWANVFIYQGWLAPDAVDANYYRWLYTALTRASRMVYLVNWSES